MPTTEQLLEMKCQPREHALDASAVAALMPAVQGWTLDDQSIVRSYGFKNYHDTLAFINAIAYVIHAEDHHPDLTVTYNKCVVKFNTHSVNNRTGGLSENDFICAVKVDAIFQQSFAGS